MPLHNLEKIFKPASVALIGASEKKGTIGWDILRNLIGSGYTGPILAINPNYDRIQGIKAFPSLSDAGQPVDLAIIATPISIVPSIVKECAALGVGAAIVISAGGKETGGAGLRIERRIREAVAETGLRILGPNSFGVICPERPLNTTFIRQMPLAGNLAFISQSGAVCAAMADLSNKEGIGFSHFASVGSMLDVDFGDLVDYLGSSEEVKSILLYMESLSNVRKFMSAARAVSRVKPIIVLKAGTSRTGAIAAASHTGASAGKDAFYDAAFKRAGIVRVATLEAFFDCAELLNKQPHPTGKRLLVITNSGGAGVMAADAIAAYDLELSTLGKETVDKLDPIMPPHWSRKNPLDILGDATPERYVQAVEGCTRGGNLDGMLLMLNPQAMTDPAETASVMARHLKAKAFPVVTAVMGGVVAEKAREVLNRGGIPTFETPERAVRAFHYLYMYGRNLKMLQEIPPRLETGLEADHGTAGEIIAQGLRKGGILTDEESKRLLASFGIAVNPTHRVRSAEEAARRAEDLGFPVVISVDSMDSAPGTPVARLWEDLRSRDEVTVAYRAVLEYLEHHDPESLEITVQPFIRNPDYQVFIGADRDPSFGPAVAFGTGGVLGDLCRDKAIGLPPLNRSLARMIMEGTRVFHLLGGYPGRPAADLNRLEELLVRLSHLVMDFPELVTLTMDPVLITKGTYLVTRARSLLAPALQKPPHHLVISPYPEQYESRETTSAGLDLTIRPIKPEDAPWLLQLFDSMSSRSIYYRFFSPLKSLSRSMLAKFTQLDYDRELALVAVETSGETEKIVGVVRFVCDPDRKRATFAVAVGDPWQGKGVGKLLLEKCVQAAGEYGVETLEGDVLAENTGMLAMCRKLGFKSSRSRTGDQFLLSINPVKSPASSR